MNDDTDKKGDLSLMIVAGGILLVGIIGLFFNLTVGGIILFVGVGLFAMGLITKKKV